MPFHSSFFLAITVATTRIEGGVWLFNNVIRFMTEPGLSDYALIGNCRSGALVSKYGSIDWCCLPDFHSPSIFAAILDRQRGGYFSIAPVNAYQSRQRYIPDTNVVETIFSTDEGEVRVIDAFTVMTEKEKTSALFPDHEILRVVEGISGESSSVLEREINDC